MRNLITKIGVVLIPIITIGLYGAKPASADQQDIREVIENANIPQPVKDFYLWQETRNAQIQQLRGEGSPVDNSLKEPYSTEIIGGIPITQSAQDIPTTLNNEISSIIYTGDKSQNVRLVVPPRPQRKSETLKELPKPYEGSPEQNSSLPNQGRFYRTPKNELGPVVEPEVLKNIYEKKVEANL